jgi:asparagine synthase (glutamine-hydrolysing)
MCGIAGAIDLDGRPLPPGFLSAMADSLVHRGPDDQGLYEAPGVGLANRRLAIIDIAGGHQPFVSDDGQVAVVQNGEIYNHIELAAGLAGTSYACRTGSDTEVLLRLYEQASDNGGDSLRFASRLNGMFAVAIHDCRRGVTWLLRDRLGVKPLFFTERHRRLLFASEIKALLRVGVPRQLDPEALDQLLTFNYVPPPRTLFAGIHHLMPGHWARVEDGQVSTHCWWSLATATRSAGAGAIGAKRLSVGDWQERFNSTLDDAVHLRLRSDAPFGAFLSGGVDSSTVVGLMARHLSEPVRTYAIGFEEASYDESGFAMAAAARFGALHTSECVDADMLGLWPRAVWHCDQPHGDISFLPTYRVAELAAHSVKMVLTGDGGDELFAGYDKYVGFFGGDGGLSSPVQSLSDAAFRSQYGNVLSVFSSQQRAALYGEAGSTSPGGLLAGLEPVAPEQTLAPLWDQLTHLDRLNQALAIDALWLLPGNNLVKPDRMGMAVSLEARTPFLDVHMVELAFAMPGELKLRGGESKWIFKRAVETLIGRELAYRRKQMFTVPVGEWFKGRLAPMVREWLLGERTRARGLFNPAAVEELVEQHHSGAANRTRQLRLLIAIEIWARSFLDPPGWPPRAMEGWP